MVYGGSESLFGLDSRKKETDTDTVCSEWGVSCYVLPAHVCKYKPPTIVSSVGQVHHSIVSKAGLLCLNCY